MSGAGTVREPAGWMRSLLAVTMLTLVAAVPSSAGPAPLRVVPTVDINRYAGTWYEIGRLPNRFQKQCAGDVVAFYQPRADGRVTVTNRCRTTSGDTAVATGVARRVDGQPPSILEVRFAPAFLSFLPAVWGDYQIIALGDAYDDAVVGTPDRAFLWVLARTPRLEPGRYRQLLDEARRQGFDVAKVVETPHAKPGA
jgi:apolipoprotein D and lipocalin family protein